ncbi:ABC transporter permease subunit [Dorea formicigenerans]|uniref:ABC transporter permease n=1 Tax=Dorea formicigenerans TaxID=39486 RepID=UPI001C025FDD|nr:ABC transporter permease [Dorea formicigenerans]MBT9742006.1 ABC transporter permease subunit [Dorea formicigenerans]
MNETELFAPYEGELDGEELAPKDAGYWKTACKIFLKNKMGVFSAIVLIVMIIFCMAGENLRPYGVQDQNTAIKNEAPSKEHWFGTDQLGRDIFVRVCHGGQVSIEIGLFASLIVSLIGVIYGSISGYLGGRTDMIMMRLVEVFKGIPHLVIVILLSIILDVKGILPLLLAMTIVGWVNTAQVVRGQVKQLKGQEFIMAAECLGVPARRIISHHIIPNMMGMVVVAITLDIPTFIFEEAFLSFIGLGLKNPAVSWGILISLAQPNLVHYPYQVAFPAIAISVAMVALNIFGNAWKEAFDPKFR